MAKKLLTDEARFMKKVAYNGECWEWMGFLRSTGYGMFHSGSRKDGSRKTGLAHRWAFQHWKSELIDGLTIDHLCRNRACVNPEHLDQCHIGENVNRSPLCNARKTECPQGHALSGDNLYLYKGKRHCRECRRINQRIGG